MNVLEVTNYGQGGEIISAQVKRIKKVTAEEFCQVYLRDNDEFYKLSKAESNLLSVCWLNSVYYDDEQFKCPGNKITFDAQFKDIAAEKTGLKEGTIKNTMAALVKKDMLLKDENYKGIYYLNPKYFFKGRINDRTQIIDKVVQYQIANQSDNFLENKGNV